MVIEMENFTYIHCNDIDHSDKGCSTILDIADMSLRIRNEWLSEPILVRPLANFRFQVVSDELVFCALLHLGINRIPCRVINDEVLQ